MLATRWIRLSSDTAEGGIECRVNLLLASLVYPFSRARWRKLIYRLSTVCLLYCRLGLACLIGGVAYGVTGVMHLWCGLWVYGLGLLRASVRGAVCLWSTWILCM